MILFPGNTIRQRIAWIGAAILIISVILYLALPVIALFFRVTPELFFSTLASQEVQSALWISLCTSAISLAIVIAVGTPFAYIHARNVYPGKVIVDTLIDLPLILPPAIAGVALLMLYGRAGFVGHCFSILGIPIAFTTLAVIMAQVFVASPFYVRQAKSLFAQVDPVYELAARTLGAGPLQIFFAIAVPMAAGELVSGAVMTFGRALGEFGATIMFAGNLPGVTQTMPLAVYVGMEGNFAVGLTISIILVVISFAIMIAVRLFSWQEAAHA